MTATCKNRAIDFLMYSYFGYDCWQENPYYCAINRAYNDATLRATLVLKKKFNNIGSYEEEDYNDRYKKTEKIRANIKLQLKAGGTDIIRKYVSLIVPDPASEKFIPNDDISKKICDYMPNNEITDKIYKNTEIYHTPFTHQNEYNDWHRATCDSLVTFYCNQYVTLLGQYEDDNAKRLAEMEAKDRQQYFSYGNAQKWVNMTMKNLYIISIMQRWISENNVQDTDSWYERIINCSKYFHIPLDSYMFDVIKNNPEMNIPPKFQTKENEYTSSWSKIGNYEDYLEYQSHVRETIESYTNPIDWEGPKWIEQAKKVKAHDKKNEWESCYKDDTYPSYPSSSPKN